MFVPVHEMRDRVFSATRVATAAMALVMAAIAKAEPPDGWTAGDGADCRVKIHNGAPTIFIDGRPFNGQIFNSMPANPAEIKLFIDAGISVFSFTCSATAGAGAFKGNDPVWKAPGEYDYRSFDDKASNLLSQKPSAYFFPRLDLSAPEWWMKAHPEDIVLVRNAKGEFEPLRLPNDPDRIKNKSIIRKTVPCWASEAWRRDTLDAIRRLVDHVEAAPYAGRVIGYHLASGESHEWFMWGNAVDWSKPNLAAYHRWLGKTYRTDDALRKAWRRPDVSLGSAEPPTAAELSKSAYGALRDPSREQNVIDYLDYQSWLVADTIEYLACGARERTGGRKLIGAFYGYIFGLTGERQQLAGHQDLTRLLESSNIDFLAGPVEYSLRGFGTKMRGFAAGTPLTMSLQGSVREHGKIWFNETDFASSISGGRKAKMGKEPLTMKTDILRQKRNFAWGLTEAMPHWWFVVAGIRYDHPDLMRAIASYIPMADKALALDRSPVDDVAYVVDEFSALRHVVADPMGQFLLREQVPSLARFGGVAGHYTLQDLPRLKRHKMIVFGDMLAPPENARRDIEAMKGDGRVLVFTYAPGLYRNGAIKEAAMKAITGIALERSRPAQPLRVAVKSDSATLKGIAGLEYGDPLPGAVDPVFVANDPEAVVLGTLPDGRPGLVMKSFKDWTAVFSSAPMLPAKLLRALAQKAGARLYTNEGDCLSACRDIVTINADAAGRKTIRLPQKRRIHDAFSGKDLGTSDAFSFDMAQYDTRMFFLYSD
jgi:hypothetical protein